jgi:DNA repair photolyase
VRQGILNEAARRTFVDPGPFREPRARGVRRRLVRRRRTLAELQTSVTEERARSIIATNDSPDVSFEQSVNAYRGLRARVRLLLRASEPRVPRALARLDFETKLFAKTNAAELLKEALAKPGYVVKPLAFGTNTDCYQPIERRYRIMRQLLEILAECEHPLTIVTKSGADRARSRPARADGQKNLVKAFVSITTLDRQLARSLEPRAASPQRRVDALRALARAGVPCGVMIGPVIPR